MFLLNSRGLNLPSSFTLLYFYYNYSAYLIYELKAVMCKNTNFSRIFKIKTSYFLYFTDYVKILYLFNNIVNFKAITH